MSYMEHCQKCGHRMVATSGGWQCQNPICLSLPTSTAPLTAPSIMQSKPREPAPPLDLERFANLPPEAMDSEEHEIQGAFMVLKSYLGRKTKQSKGAHEAIDLIYSERRSLREENARLKLDKIDMLSLANKAFALIDRCVLYGPHDAARESIRKFRQAAS